MSEAPVCLITGASGGLASGIARRLNHDGYRLILCREVDARNWQKNLGKLDLQGPS